MVGCRESRWFLLERTLLWDRYIHYLPECSLGYRHHKRLETRYTGCKEEYKEGNYWTHPGRTLLWDMYRHFH